MNDQINQWFYDTFPGWLGDDLRWPVIVFAPILIGLMLSAAHRMRQPFPWLAGGFAACLFVSAGRSIDNLGTGMSYPALFNFVAVVLGYVFLWKDRAWIFRPREPEPPADGE